MKVNGKSYKTLWVENNVVKIIDQTKLPFEFKIIELGDLKSFCEAISFMRVRGAPLIGVTAAFGMAISLSKDPSDINIEESHKELLSTRPTAVNLKWAIDIVKDECIKIDLKLRPRKALKIAKNILKSDLASCKAIGKHGSKVIEKIYQKKKKVVNILTHCNAGWLAAIDWGTALAPIFMAKKKKIPMHIWVDETRPRNQGALTSWELYNEKIPNTVIVDNAGGHLMKNGLVDLCIVGSDRTTINGDVCNKIGTYLKALAAFDNKIPFYVALPSSTIDSNMKTNKNNIQIEERSSTEISHIKSLENNEVKNIRIFPKEVKTYNPAFDVTPSKMVTGLITEHGLCNAKRSEIIKILKKQKI